MENHKTADKVCCSKKIMSQLPGFKQDVSLLVLANLCKTFWCHCPQVWSGLSLHFVFPMLAANIWRVHLTVLSICTSRPALQDTHHQEPWPVQLTEAWEEKENVELILETIHSRFTPAYLWEKYGANIWLKPLRNAGPVGGASEGLCHGIWVLNIIWMYPLNMTRK